MINHREYICIGLIAIFTGVSAIFAEVPKDDVYYWPDTYDREGSEDYETISKTELQGPTQTETNKPQVIFIEDNDTQHSDTVVRAIIRR